jgi:hypothetical protein
MRGVVGRGSLLRAGRIVANLASANKQKIFPDFTAARNVRGSDDHPGLTKSGRF